MWTRCRWPAAALLAATLLFAGCDTSSPEVMLDNYASRVGNTLDQSIDPELELAGHLPLFPPRRERLLPLTDIRQGLIEVLALRHCQLLPLIAERNSSLGKVMAPSQQLVYEIRFLERLRSCRFRLDRDPGADPELRAQVSGILAIKQRELPAALWNALYVSDEMEVNFSRGDPPLPLAAAPGSPPALTALEQLTGLVRLTAEPGWHLPDLLERIEEPYEALYRDRFGSQWLKSLLMLTETLDTTAQGLEAREQRYPLCPQRRPTPDAKILLNVFTRYYAGEVQPYLARVHRDGSRWRDLHGELIQRLPATDAMQRYWDAVFATDNPDSLWQRYIDARDRHTRAWQRVLRHCGLMPGSESAKGD